MYELVPESESELREAQVNLTEIIEDLNQSSEEPKASSAQEGKPQSMSCLFLNLCNLLLFLSTCAFKFIGITWNPSCITLSTYVWILACIGR